LYKEFLFGFYPLFFWSDWLPLIVTYIFPPFFNQNTNGSRAKLFNFFSYFDPSLQCL
jgi:hypothetical protein